MKQYDKEKPLISLHIPKCGGTSIAYVLKQWYGVKYFSHYFQKHHANPPKYDLQPGMCIHGHFNTQKGFGVMEYYPEVDQFITFVREPLSVAVSNYHFWKQKARAKQIYRGDLKEGDLHDYKNLHDFFTLRPKSHLFTFLPFNLTEDNYKEIIHHHFVYIGIVEDMQTSLNCLADRLCFPAINLVHLNKSEHRGEELSNDIKNTFIQNNRLECEVYRYIRQIYKTPGRKFFDVLRFW
jgi:hypothetical protein